MIKKYLVVLLLLVNNAFAQAMINKVIPLHYVQADKVLQLIRPLIHSGEQISGNGQTLVVRVSVQTLAEIRSVLHQIDIPPVMFTVSVYQGDPDWLSATNSNDVHYGTQSSAEVQRSQSVRVMSGQSAMIQTEKEVPIVSAVGVGFDTGISYDEHAIENGLLVKPILQGAQVRLMVKRIREQANAAGGQQFDNQNLDTTLMVPLNKWVPLGSAEGTTQTDQTTVSYSAGRSFSRHSTLYVKVSIIHEQPSTWGQ